MANEAKKYFLAPTWDYPPGGPIALGNVILSPSRPVPPLVPASQLSHNLDLKTTSPDPTGDGQPSPLATSRTTKHNITWTRAKSSTYSLGVWTKFLEYLGVNLDFETARSTHDIFRFESMSTEEFFPDEQFLSTTLLAHPAARRRLDQRKPAYVIVGVKTVSGAQVKRVWGNRVGTQVEVGVDVGIAGGLPVSGVSVGPAGGLEWEKGEGTGFEGGDDFVFAYRVIKVRLKRRRGQVVSEEYVRGAMLGMEMEEGQTLRAVGVGVGDGIRANSVSEMTRTRIRDAMDVAERIGERRGQDVEEYIEVEPVEEQDDGSWSGVWVVEGDDAQEVQVFEPKVGS